jgi:hypothetical protein
MDLNDLNDLNFLPEWDDTHKKVIEDVLLKFRELFNHWVSTFQKDAYEDEWGLFV